MKKVLAIVTLLLIVSCTNRGEVQQAPVDFIKIHNKVYKIMSIIPQDGANAIYIMYPKDSTDAQPEVINWTEQHGKSYSTQALIKVN